MSENHVTRHQPIKEVEPENGHRRFQTDGDPYEIVYEQQTPATIEDATVTRATLQQICRLLGHNPDEVMEIHATAHEVTIRTLPRTDGTMIRRAEGRYLGHEHTKHVI